MHSRLALLGVFALAIAGCGLVASPSPTPVTQRFPGYLRVEVTLDGRVLVEETAMTVAQLTTVLDGLAATRPVILYHREESTADPPPIYLDVLDTIVAHRLLVSFVEGDFTADDYAPPPPPS